MLPSIRWRAWRCRTELLARRTGRQRLPEKHSRCVFGVAHALIDWFFYSICSSLVTGNYCQEFIRYCMCLKMALVKPSLELHRYLMEERAREYECGYIPVTAINIDKYRLSTDTRFRRTFRVKSRYYYYYVICYTCIEHVYTAARASDGMSMWAGPGRSDKTDNFNLTSLFTSSLQPPASQMESNSLQLPSRSCPTAPCTTPRYLLSEPRNRRAILALLRMYRHTIEI